MATSSSNDALAGIDVFSGRPNPTWRISRADVDRLKRIWESLSIPDSASMPTPAPLLGYRGCFVQDNDARWVAFGDQVTLQRPQGSETRRDNGREIERLILESAPADIPVAALILLK